jgi:hypothetical protein
MNTNRNANANIDQLCYRKGALGAGCYCFAYGVRSKWGYEHIIKGCGEYFYGKRIYSVNISSKHCTCLSNV